MCCVTSRTRRAVKPAPVGVLDVPAPVIMPNRAPILIDAARTLLYASTNDLLSFPPGVQGVATSVNL